MSALRGGLDAGPAVDAWLDDLAEGVVLVENGRVVRLNAAAATLLEVERARALGAPAIAVLRDHRLEAVLASGGEVEVETRGRRLVARAVPGGLVLLDVSDLRRAQDDARELLAVLSHELRTPVTAIRAALDALVDGPPETLRERFLGRARDEVERLVRLLDDLTVDVRAPRERRLPLREVGQRAASVLQPTLTRHRVVVELELPTIDVWADEDKLLQVLVNLIENAAVHGPDGGRIRVVGRRERDVVVLEVHDEGAALEPSRIEPLFAPHSRGHGVKVKGTGLGLFIVRSIAQRWGGRAWGGPARGGRGNVFGVTVPLPPAAASARTSERCGPSPSGAGPGEADGWEADGDRGRGGAEGDDPTPRPRG